MGVGTAAMLVEFVFSKYLPTFSWLTYASQITTQTPSMTLFAIMTKIAVEVYHQVKGESFTEVSFASTDVIQALFGILLLALVGEESFLLGLTYIELTKNFALFSINTSRDYIL